MMNILDYNSNFVTLVNRFGNHYHIPWQTESDDPLYWERERCRLIFTSWRNITGRSQDKGTMIPRGKILRSRTY
jgi:hypothetical protein